MIKGIQLVIDGKTVVIPIEKARELYDDLGTLFAAPISYPYINPLDRTFGISPSTDWPRAGWGVKDGITTYTKASPVTSALRENMSN